MVKLRVHALLLVATIYLVLLQPLWSACPPADKLDERRLSCIAGLTMTAARFLKASALKEFCGSHAETNIKCLETMYNDCKANATMRQMLDRTTNITDVRTAIRTMCDNIETLAAKEQCLANEEADVTKCNMPGLAELQNAAATPASDPRRQERIQNARCNYTRRRFDCQQRIGDRCGKDVLRIMNTIAKTTNPPSCGRLPIESTSRNSAPPDSITSHNVITGFLCIVTFVSYFCLT